MRAFLNADNERSRMLARHARSWMDAQARPMVVVTPRRHVGGMDEMTDEEIVGLWGMVGEVVGLWVESPASQVSRFKRIVLNAGTFRNIEHAHVKVYFETMDFISRMSSWPPQLHDLYNRLYASPSSHETPEPTKDSYAFRHIGTSSSNLH
ncbi:hypothetical protein BC829DRAFT_101380 [Chytridium lagenaria]|nr:hypothetical protein BC829DRAFT_101380 [Chytridium lagenaria]